MKHLANVSNLLLTLLLVFLNIPASTGQARWLFPSPEENLVKAAETGDVVLARKAIAKGVDVNARIRYQNDDNWTALLIAVRRGNIAEIGEEYQGERRRGQIEVAKLLLRYGADVNVKTSYEITPLMEAVGNAEMLRLLLDHGADVHATDYQGMTALGHAVWGGRYYTVMLLIQHGADMTVTTDSGETLLYLAAGSPGGNPALVKYLLEHGLDVNATASGGRTALMEAVNTGDVDVVKLLLEHGADPEAKTSWNWGTALIRAASRWPDIVELLLKYGANVNTKSDTGWTALLEAAEFGNTAVAEILLEYGADVQGEVGQEVLWRHIQGMRCEPEFIDLLREYGVEVTEKDRCEESK